MTIALAIFLAAFGLLKLWLGLSALWRMRAFRAGVAGTLDPAAGHSSLWLFWAWVSWRFAAAALAIAVAIGLLSGRLQFV